MATSFANDILPMFTPEDIQHMQNQGLDLSAYDEVKSESAQILARLKKLGAGRMPPPPRPAWTPAQITLFQTWVADGCPP